MCRNKSLLNALLINQHGDIKVRGVLAQASTPRTLSISRANDGHHKKGGYRENKLPTLFCILMKTKNQAQMYYQRRRKRHSFQSNLL